MFSRPLAAVRSRSPSFDVACLVALGALASCGTPFTSAASPCADQGGDCAVISGHVNQAGASSSTAAAGEGDDVTGQGGVLGGDGGSSAGNSAAGQGGADGGSGSEPSVSLPVSCRDALEHNAKLGDGDVTIDPDGSGPVAAFDAHCDMTSDGGGWTEIGIGEYWQKNDIQLKADAVLPWAEVTALLRASQHVFRAGDGQQRLYLKDVGALIEKVSDPEGTNSLQSFLWRSTAPSLECAKSYAALTSNSMLTVTTKEVSCEPFGFGKHMCGVAAGWILFHRNDTTNWSGQNPCAFPIAVGATSASPTLGALRPLWLR
jgi:hypothetical protein